MFSGLIHRNILSPFELFEELLSILFVLKNKNIFWASVFIDDIPIGMYSIIEKPTASHSILSNHQEMTEVKSDVAI
jgi:hypothetical protein